jgi:hypothetical protein
MTDAAEPLLSALRDPGFAFLRAADARPLLEACGGLGDWDAFAASWGRLELDTYMADGGRYRRRRHATYAVTPGDPAIRRQPHQPHYQGLEYNRLNGGIARWFEPVEPAVAEGKTLLTVLRFCRALFDRLAPETAWHIELHQFRIEPTEGAGQPTPEGLHRDGVDYVLVLMVQRRNIASGVTSVHGEDQALLGSFTLTDPLDIALVNDRRVFHGVTAVQPLDPAEPAWRDVLVVTFRRAS